MQHLPLQPAGYTVHGPCVNNGATLTDLYLLCCGVPLPLSRLHCVLQGACGALLTAGLGRCVMQGTAVCPWLMGPRLVLPKVLGCWA